MLNFEYSARDRTNLSSFCTGLVQNLHRKRTRISLTKNYENGLLWILS